MTTFGEQIAPATVPNTTVRNSTAPNSTALNTRAQNAAAQSTVSQSTVPQNTVSQNTVPHGVETPHTAAAEKTALLFKQLGNAARLRILLLLAAAPSSVSEITQALQISQPLVSQHLKTLRETSLVTSEKNGKTVIYRLADEHVTHIIRDALAHVAETPERKTHEHHP